MAAARSMTGFAEAKAECGDFSVGISIRSVNHRSLDLKLRVPARASRLERDVRRAIRKRVRRGSIQVTIELHSGGPSVTRLDRGLIEARLGALQQIAELCGVEARPDPNLLLNLPGTFVTEESQIPEEKLESLVAAALDQALSVLDTARAEEARALVLDIGGHVGTIEAEVDHLGESVSYAVELRRTSIRERIDELLGVETVDPHRLAQEAALIASRADISEELLRLRAHAHGLRRCLECSPEVGKRIDFLAQEMNREANTLLSKTQALGAPGLEMTEAGLRIRAAIEKIREQALNLE